MYRAYAYLTLENETFTTLAASGVPTFLEADRVLQRLLALPGVTGGGLEVRVPNFGWVMVENEDDVETLQYTSRFRESD